MSFRYYVKKKADELQLFGFVENQRDGRLYIEVEGEPEMIEKFVQWCRKGPNSAEVSNVEIREETTKNFTDFQIKYIQ